MPLTMAATWSSPRCRSSSTAWSLVSPSGSCAPITPEKMRSVARPSTRGPKAIATTLTTVRPMTASVLVRYGDIRPTSRRADGPKALAFCPTMPPPMGPRPGPGPASMRSVSLRVPGACFSVSVMRPLPP